MRRRQLEHKHRPMASTDTNTTSTSTSSRQRTLYLILFILLSPLLLLALLVWALVGLLLTCPVYFLSAVGFSIVLTLSILLQLDQDAATLIDWPIVFLIVCVLFFLKQDFKRLHLSLVAGTWIYCTLRRILTSFQDTQLANILMTVSVILPVLLLLSAWRIWRPIAQEKLQKAETMLYHMAELQGAFRMTKIAGLGTVHVRYNGTKQDNVKTIVLLHGFGAGNGFWAMNLKHLSKDFDVYAVEWLGVGRSNRPCFNPKSHQEADDFFINALENWRKEVDLDKFVLCGHSMGAMIATSYATQFPQRIHHLILASPAGVGRPPAIDSTKKLPLPFRILRRLWQMKLTPMSLVRFVGPFGPSLLNRVVHLRVEWMPESSALRNGQLELTLVCEYTYQNWAHKKSGENAMHTHLLPGAFAKRPLCDLLTRDRVKFPISFMYGGGPDWMDAAHGQKVVDQLKDTNDVDIWIVPDAGHQLFLDNPEDFNRMITETILKRSF